jgi:hypothetical protein
MDKKREIWRSLHRSVKMRKRWTNQQRNTNRENRCTKEWTSEDIIRYGIKDID